MTTTARIDHAHSTLVVDLVDLYRTAVEWHVDEDATAEQTLGYARRFICRLLGTGTVADTRADEGRNWAAVTRALPLATLAGLVAVERDLADTLAEWAADELDADICTCEIPFSDTCPACRADA